MHATGKLVIVTGSNLLDSSLSVKSHPDGLIGLDKLIELTGKLLVLNGDDPDVVVQGVNLYLKIRVVIQQGTVAVTGALKLFSHVHYLVFLGADLCLEILDGGGKLDVARTFRVDSLLEIGVLVSVLVLKGLEVVELILEGDNLVLELDDFSLTLDKLGFFTLEIEGLGVDELVEVVDSRELLGDVVLEGSGLSSQIG